MPLQIVRNDITNMEVDAIVNAANESLLGGGGVDGAIHRAAGPLLLEECKTLGGCKTGDAKITKGYNLKAKYIIHTVGPIWYGGNNGERELLKSCYQKSLEIAMETGCESIAFPLISAGIYGYPKDKAMGVALEVIAEFLNEHEMLVYMVIFDKKAVTLSEKLFADIEQYIDDNYVEEHADYSRRIEYNMPMPCASMPSYDTASVPQKEKPIEKLKSKLHKKSQEVQTNAVEYSEKAYIEEDEFSLNNELDDILDGMIDESFSEMLIRLIDEKGMKDSECYKKANIDRKLFSKIRSNKDYKPSKPTAIAFCIALELNLHDTKDMLMKAGYALSHSNKFDIIIEYFIKHSNYNIFEINEVLFSYDQNILGG